MASKKILIQVDVTTKSAEVQINKVVDSMNKLEGATAKFTDTTKKSRAQTGLNNAILIESGRFASDLRFGFTAVANNLGRIIELGQEFSRTEGGGLIPALKRIFTAQGLFLIGFQLVIAYGDKIFNFFRGVTEEAQKAAKAQEELNKQLDDLGAKTFLMQDYVDVIEDVNTTEETRKNLTNELISLVPDLEDADFKYGKNLDNVREKIEDYALSQATRIEIDRLVEENADILAASAAVRRINEIEDEQKKVEEMKKFLEKEGMDVDARIRERKFGAQSILETETEAIMTLFALQTTSAVLASVEIENTLEELYKNIKSRNKKGLDDENEYIKTRIAGVESEQRAVRDIGKIRRKYFKENQDFEVEQLTSERDRIELRRTQALSELDAINASEGLKLQARFEINKFYNNLIIEDEERVAEARKAIQLGIVSTYAKALGSLSQLLGKNTKAGKIAALGEIAAGTAVGFIQALDIAQKTAKGTGPAAAFAFPVFYASQVAAVLGAAAQAKQIIESGRKTSPSGPTSGTSAPSITTEAPDFNVVGAGGVSQLAAGLAGITGRPLKAFVVSKEISSAQELDRNITNNAQID